MAECDPKAAHNDPNQEHAGQDAAGRLVKQTPGLDPEVTRATAGPDWPPHIRGDFSDDDVERDAFAPLRPAYRDRSGISPTYRIPSRGSAIHGATLSRHVR